MKVLVMKNEFLITGPSLKPKDKEAKMLVIFFHGWGSNGDDLIQLAPFFAKDFPSAYFLSPNGPEECPQNPFGGKQWFGLDFNSDGSIDRSNMPEKVAFAAEHANKYIKYWQNKLSLSNEKTILIGFSQGSMLSLEIGFLLISSTVKTSESTCVGCEDGLKPFITGIFKFLLNSNIFSSLSVLSIKPSPYVDKIFAVSARLSPPLPKCISFDFKVIVPPPNCFIAR